MKRIFYILLPVFAVQCNALLAQMTAGELMREVNIIAARNSVGGLSYGAIKGSPYYSDEFIDGEVYLKNGKEYSVPLRYDLFNDEMEFRQNEQVLWLNKRDVLSIQYGKELLIEEPVPASPGKSTYFFILAEGKYALYIRKQVKFSPKEPAQGYADPVPDRFERETDLYYLKEEGAPAKEINNKKALQEMLAENKAALDFIKKSKTRVTKAEDLMELVDFLNSQ